MTDTATQIKDILTSLRKHGCIVFNMNSHKANNRGNTGLPDFIILSRKSVYFAEVKVGKDVLSPDQAKVKEFIERIGEKYHLITSEQAATDLKTEIITE